MRAKVGLCSGAWTVALSACCSSTFDCSVCWQPGLYVFVVDNVTKNTLPWAKVLASDFVCEPVAKPSGWFRCPSELGKYQIEVTLEGYHTHHSSFQLVNYRDGCCGCGPFGRVEVTLKRRKQPDDPSALLPSLVSPVRADDAVSSCQSGPF